MTENRFTGRDLLPDEHFRYTTAIEARLVESASGLCVVFEHREVNWPNTRCEAFYVARHDFDRDGPEPGTPPEVESHLREPGWSHFIWIPERFTRGSVYQFSIRYAHELQHYRQVLGAESLRQARSFLSGLRRKGFVPQLAVEGNPLEFDAEMMAVDTFRAIHGEAALEDFIQAQDAEMASYYRRVLSLREKFVNEPV